MTNINYRCDQHHYQYRQLGQLCLTNHLVMETQIEAQLASELQEIYLENKEWQSDILYLADEMRFFQQLFKKVVSGPVKQNNFEQVEFIKLSLLELTKRRDHLKSILNNRQYVLTSMLKNEVKTITLAFIEEDTAIVTEIKALLAEDKQVRKNLFALIEGLQVKDKIQKYPIL